MKKLNKKGFTLIELLAVIVILAVLMLLAAPSVLNIMNNARKNSFATEAMSLLNAAKTKYAADGMSTSFEATKCYTMDDLKPYVDKDFDAGSKVSIHISSAADGSSVTYTTSYTNGVYTINKVEGTKITDTDVKDVTKDSYEQACP